MTWHVYRQGSLEYFLGFEFRESVFFCVLVTAAVFFGLLNKGCFFKCFIFSTVFSGPVLFTRASIIIGINFYHIMLDFCEMNFV